MRVDLGRSVFMSVRGYICAVQIVKLSENFRLKHSYIKPLKFATAIHDGTMKHAL
jgi:hypothetical protein